MPGGPNYYRNTAVFSDDQGKSWNRTAVVTDLGGTIYPDGIMRRKTLVGRTAGKIWNRVDWAPKPLDVSPAKERLLKAVSARMEVLRTAA